MKGSLKAKAKVKTPKAIKLPKIKVPTTKPKPLKTKFITPRQARTMPLDKLSNQLSAQY